MLSTMKDFFELESEVAVVKAIAGGVVMAGVMFTLMFIMAGLGVW